MDEWLASSPPAFVAVAVSFVVVYLSISFFTRVSGLRSVSKMSAPDSAMTVAIGSLFASSIATRSPPLPVAVFAMGPLCAGQWSLAVLRQRSTKAAGVLDNTPVLLMDKGEYQRDNMQAANVSEQDIVAKLREASVIEFSQIRAVVFETRTISWCCTAQAMPQSLMIDCSKVSNAKVDGREEAAQSDADR